MSRRESSWKRVFRIPVWLGAVLFLAIALFFLWEEHRAHLLGLLPYAILLLCPLIHLLMHGNHGDRGGGHLSHETSPVPQTEKRQ